MSSIESQGNCYNVCAATQAGIKAAWFGRSNPYKVGSELYIAFNRGRRMAAECAPGLGKDFVWYNSYTFEGLRWDEVSSITDGLIG